MLNIKWEFCQILWHLDRWQPSEQVTDISVLNGSYKLQFETSKSKLMIIFTLIYRKLPQREATQVIKTHRYVQNKPKKSSGEWRSNLQFDPTEPACEEYVLSQSIIDTIDL